MVEPDPAPPQRTAPAQVSVQDAFGRIVQIPRERWRREVLPRLVDAYAHDPARLVVLVLQHLRDGLAADLLPAALRLAAVDPDPERGLAVLAAVQREAGEAELSEATLRELLQRRPASPAARVGLAALRAAADRPAATALLWEALQLDPNHADALHGFLQWEHERVGEAGYGAVLERAAALPGAWRALLWRGRRALFAQQHEAALADYRAGLQLAGEAPDALTMVAQDLVQARRLHELAELVLPRYRIDRHPPQVGLCLLQLFLERRAAAQGEQLLHELRLRFPRQLDQHLARFDAEFTRLRLAAQQEQQEQQARLLPPAEAAPPRVVLHALDRPLWFGPLGNPEFLLPPKTRPPRRVLLCPLSVHEAAAVPQAAQREDEQGRLTRSVPLFLAEQFWLLTELAPVVILPVAAGGGWVVAATPWPEEQLLALHGGGSGPVVLVTGVLRLEQSRRRVDLQVYDGQSRSRIGHAAAEGETGRLGPLLLQLCDELVPLLGGARPARQGLGSDVFWDRHAAGLGQLAALVAAQLGAVTKDRIYGQRAMLEWLLATALAEPRWIPGKLAFAAGLCADAALGSPVHKEFAQPFAELFRIEPRESPFARVAALPLRRLALEPLWQHRRAEITAGADEGYRRWLRAVEA